MVSRQNSARRRRIAIDPNIQGAEAGSALDDLRNARSPKRNRVLYKSGAERRYQWKTTDLLPKRTWGISLTVALLVLAVITVNMLHVYSARWSNYLGTSGVAALQLTGRSTLAAWFSSFLLIISALASLQIFALRQHRQDDYRGSYRLWLWMAAVLLLASVHCIVDLTTIGSNVIHFLTSFSYEASLLSVIVFKLLLLTGLVARACYEVRESRSTLVLVALVWIAYAASATLRLPQLQPIISEIEGQTFEFTQGNLVLFGTEFLLMAHLVFARFVYLQALGMIKPKIANRSKKKSKNKLKTKSKSPNSRSDKKTLSSTDERSESATEPDENEIDNKSEKSTLKKSADQKRDSAFSSSRPAAAPPTKVSPLTKYTSQRPNQQNSGEDDESDQDDQSVLRLSKSEQRRQRKQQQHRRAA